MINTYHNAIRSHVDLLTRRGRTDQLIQWDVDSDECFDPTLISQRIYESREYADVIMVCAGTNRIGEKLPNRIINLPKVSSLIAIKKQHLTS